MYRSLAILPFVLISACSSTVRPQTTRSTARPTQQQNTTQQRQQPTPTVTETLEPPAFGCRTDGPLLPGFVTDDQAIHGITATPSDFPLEELANGHLRIRYPRTWFPARIDDEAFTAYQVLTGSDSDRLGVYLGNTPLFRPPAQAETFRLLLGTIALRGAIWLDQGLHRIDAVGILPCAGPRYVRIWGSTPDPAHINQFVNMVRTLSVVQERRIVLPRTPIDTTASQAVFTRLLPSDSWTRQMLLSAFNRGQLSSRYPLEATDHPLADQLITGETDTTLGNVPVHLLINVIGSSGRLSLPRTLTGLSSPNTASALSRMMQTHCTQPTVTIAHDALRLACADQVSTEFRGVLFESEGPDAISATAQRIATVQNALHSWQNRPAVMGGFPRTFCDLHNAVVTMDGQEIYAGSERCVVSVHAQQQTITALAVEGDCASLPTEPWTQPLRRVGQFDEVRGPQGNFCTYSLGWTPQSSYLIAVGNEGTASGPISRGVTLGVDRRAIRTAVAFMHELARYLTQQANEPPANIQPSVLNALGIDTPGGPGANVWLRRLGSRGGIAGPALSSVLSARNTGQDSVEVTFLSVVIELRRNISVGGAINRNWMITSVQTSHR